ncbi:MAG: hypothetical protein D6710_00115 [Nitrospirae bacterium]|nr:MAG: hypothetical protein D6710_00115 [Nitrospirota bacterium]
MIFAITYAPPSKIMRLLNSSFIGNSTYKPKEFYPISIENYNVKGKLRPCLLTALKHIMLNVF